MWIVDTQQVSLEYVTCGLWTHSVSLEYVACGLWTHLKCHWNMLHVDCGHTASVIRICYMWIVDTQKVSLEYIALDCGHTSSVIGICYMWIVYTQKVPLEYVTCGLWTHRKSH